MLNIFKDRGPDHMLEVYDTDCETPELIWNSLLRDELRAAITAQLDHVVSVDDFEYSLKNFSLDAMFSVKYEQLEDRLFIGGVYVEYFLKDPSFQVRDPNGFFEMLLAQWSQSLELIINNDDSVDEAQQNRNSTQISDHNVLEIVTSACTTLCKRPHLSMKLAPWGYMKRAVTFIHRLVAKNLLASPLMCAVKLLNAGALERVNVEAIIHSCDSDGKNGIVDGIMQSVGIVDLHPDSDFLLVTLKNIIRDALGDVEKSDAVSYHDTIAGASSIVKICDIAPSPAPGTEPVQKMKKLAGGDPLSMLLGAGDPPPASSSKNSARSVKAVRSQNSATPRGQPNIARTIQKPATSQTMTPRNNVMNHVSSGVAQGATKSRNNVQQHKGSQRNLRSNAQNQPSQTRNIMESRRNTINPNSNVGGKVSAPNINNMTKTSTEYKHALPNNRRGVRPIRSQSNHLMRGRQEVMDPLQMPSSQNDAMNTIVQAQRSHSASAFNNSASTTYGQHGIVSKRNQMGNTVGDQRNTPGAYDNTPQFRRQTQYANPNVAVQNNAINPNSQHANGVANIASLQSHVNRHAASFAPQNVQQINLQSQQYQQTQAPLVAATGPSFQTPAQYSGPNVPIQNNTFQRSLQHNNGIANPTTLSSQVNPHLTNFAQNVRPNNMPSLQYQQTHSPLGTTAGTGVPQPHVTPRTPQEQVQVSNLSENSGQIPVPNMNSYPNEGQASKTNIVQQGTEQSHFNTTSSGFQTNSSLDHDPMVIAEQKITSSSGAPGSARGRDILLSSILKCGLVPFLVDNVLENSTSESVLQPDLLKANAVDIIQLLLMDPGYGLMFQLILNKHPNWKNHQG